MKSFLKRLFKKKSNSLAVLVGRFQTPLLHEGHKSLIEEALKNHNEVLVFIGVASVMSESNFLPYDVVKLMMETEYPTIKFLPIKDVNDDKLWCETLDSEIKKEYGDREVMMYGGGGNKTSFIDQYKKYGKHKYTLIPEVKNICATDYRKIFSKTVVNSVDHRIGLLQAQYRKYPTAFRTADIIVTRYNNDGEIEILLGQKHNETHTKQWRFAGGFVDVSDLTGRDAAARELKEETNLVIDPSKFKIIDEVKIDDWRYKGTKDGIMTTIYTTHINNHLNPVAGDDLANLKWFTLGEAELIIRPLHKIILNIFKNSSIFVSELESDITNI